MRDVEAERNKKARTEAEERRKRTMQTINEQIDKAG